MKNIYAHYDIFNIQKIDLFFKAHQLQILTLKGEKGTREKFSKENFNYDQLQHKRK